MTTNNASQTDSQSASKKARQTAKQRQAAQSAKGDNVSQTDSQTDSASQTDSQSMYVTNAPDIMAALADITPEASDSQPEVSAAPEAEVSQPEAEAEVSAAPAPATEAEPATEPEVTVPEAEAAVPAPEAEASADSQPEAAAPEVSQTDSAAPEVTVPAPAVKLSMLPLSVSGKASESVIALAARKHMEQAAERAALSKLRRATPLELKTGASTRFLAALSTNDWETAAYVGAGSGMYGTYVYTDKLHAFSTESDGNISIGMRGIVTFRGIDSKLHKIYASVSRSVTGDRQSGYVISTERTASNISELDFYATLDSVSAPEMERQLQSALKAGRKLSSRLVIYAEMRRAARAVSALAAD